MCLSKQIGQYKKSEIVFVEPHMNTASRTNKIEAEMFRSIVHNCTNLSYTTIRCLFITWNDAPQWRDLFPVTSYINISFKGYRCNFTYRAHRQAENINNSFKFYLRKMTFFLLTMLIGISLIRNCGRIRFSGWKVYCTICGPNIFKYQ